VTASEKLLHIDIPVNLSDVRTVFSIGALAFEGDLPASIFHLQLIENDIADWNAKSAVIAVFHTNAGHVTLHDSAYNADRNIATGSPYKDLISDLQKRGVQIELAARRRKSTNGGTRICFPASSQHGCHGENDAACSAGICENHGVSRRSGRQCRVAYA
jgi:hypothetical protein